MRAAWRQRIFADEDESGAEEEKKPELPAIASSRGEPPRASVDAASGGDGTPGGAWVGEGEGERYVSPSVLASALEAAKPGRGHGTEAAWAGCTPNEVLQEPEENPNKCGVILSVGLLDTVLHDLRQRVETLNAEPLGSEENLNRRWERLCVAPPADSRARRPVAQECAPVAEPEAALNKRKEIPNAVPTKAALDLNKRVETMSEAPKATRKAGQVPEAT